MYVLLVQQPKATAQIGVLSPRAGIPKLDKKQIMFLKTKKLLYICSVYMKIEQWEKLANIFNVPLKDIHEYDEKLTIINKDNVAVNYNGDNNIYPIPESLLESLQEYIAILKEENRELKKMVEKR